MAVALRRKHDARAARLIGAVQQHGCARLGRERRVDGRDEGQFVPASQRRGAVAASLRSGVRLTRARGRDLQPRERRRIGRARARIDQQWQRVGNRSAAVAALSKRARPAEDEQAAAAAVDKVAQSSAADRR